MLNGLVFRRERLAEVWEDLLPLLQKHWEEIAFYPDIPMSPDKDAYLKLEQAGAFITYVVWDISDRIVGYQGFFIKHNLHYKESKQAAQDVIYLSPEVRGEGWKFIDWCDQQLKDEGVQVVVQHMKAKHSFGPTLEKLNYQLQDLIYTRRLDQ